MFGNYQMVLRPDDLDDVRAAVRVTAAAGLSLSVRTDDHPAASPDADVVLDLRGFAELRSIGADVFELDRGCHR